MSLEIFVASAVNLPPLTKTGKLNPFLQFDLRGISKETTHKPETLEPVWEELISFDLRSTKPLNDDDGITVTAKSYENYGAHKLIGSSVIPISSILKSKGPLTIDVQLTDTLDKTCGTIYLKIMHQSTGTEGDPSKNNITSALFVKKREFSNKPEKFQVRIKAIEARNLGGDNINPLCRIRLNDDVRQTSIQRMTNQPWWDETFNLTVTKISEEFFNDAIKFEVLNAKFLRTNAIIGCFLMEIRSIYDQPNHAYVNKWLMLGPAETDDDDGNNEANGVLGYLKVSVAVLASGDECPSFKTDPQSFDEDVESNLLWPESGAILQPAYFALNLYQAEDLPRMDSAVMDDIKKLFGTSTTDKELVDPYLIMSFCGRQFPSLSNQLKFTLMDWDRMSEDDLIATAYLDLSSISSSGEDGYLPNFGPCFINFYGNTREFSSIQSALDIELNSGKIEGYAYRGRMLIMLKTNLGSNPEIPISSLEPDDLLRIGPYCRRRKYILRGVFLDATMIREQTDPIEFQMSIGLYGDKFENTSMPSISTTLPSTAIFDGCQYYFLPWTKSKPCLMVPCQWEDISFRLETLNLFERITSRLQENLKKFNMLVRSGISTEDQCFLLNGILDKLINDCNTKLPEAQEGYHVTTELDRLMNVLRKKKLQELIDQAEELRNSNKNVESILEEIQMFQKILQKLGVEAQNSMPDVIITMIIGKKLVAYHRIPAHTILFSPDKNLQGRFCDVIQTLYLKTPGKTQPELIPVLLRVKLWLGLEIQYNNCAQSNEDAELCTFAESYENQVNILGKWTTRGPLMTRPPWSDAYGQLSIPREKFLAPTGWTFEGDWFINPEISEEMEQEIGITNYLEVIIENQWRGFGGTWYPSSHPWTDVRGNPTVSWEEFQCPDGWEWNDYWQVDLQRAVDEEGWEYAIDENFGGYSAAEKTYHMFRTRRWTRSRTWKNFRRYNSMDTLLETSSQLDDSEGWEYASMFNKKFHPIKQKMDLVRRRRWHRKLVPISSGSLPIFHFSDIRRSDKPVLNIFQNEASNVADDSRIHALAFYTVPRMQITYKEEYKYQLRVYLYQAKDLTAGDKTGFSDPYACVCFQNRSQKSEIIKQTVCPTWDQTLIFDQLTLYGRRESILKNIPKIIVEIFDYDNIGLPEFLGRTIIEPKTHKSKKLIAPKLRWSTVNIGNKTAGEVLATADIFQIDNEDAPALPPRLGNLYKIPLNIKPLMQRTAIEILCWGLRNIKAFEFLPVNHPSVTFEIGESIIQSNILKNMKQSPNFNEPLLFLNLMLPTEELYMPAIIIKVMDHRQFGRTPIIGTHIITNLQPFFCEPLYNDNEDVSDFDEEATIHQSETVSLAVESMERDEDDLDWWAKYYASVGEVHKSGDYLQCGYKQIQIYDTELERVEMFENFNDFLTTFTLNRGKLLNQDDGEGYAGELKGTFRIYSLPEDNDQPPPSKILQWLPSSNNVDVLIRLYIIRAYDLVPKDPNGLADPYIMVKMGKFKQNTRKNYKPNTLTPLFGQMFEFTTILPLHKDLHISIYDMDLIGSDDLIGETKIDLENRYLTRYRALCGLPKQYFTDGPFQWREAKRPREILNDVCRAQNLPIPKYKRGAFYIGKTKYVLQDFEPKFIPIPYLGPVDEILALHILHTMTVVPEHVETRRLFNPSIPGMDQGKIELWVDIFPKSYGIPRPPVNILPRTPKKYELRCVIWNTKEVAMKDISITGELMSDIYVKGWIDGTTDIQTTDIHYRSMDGEGNFNWRFVFSMDYLAAEKTIIVHKKEHFWEMDTREYSFPPKLCIQIWDNDLLASDDFIGYLELDLLNVPKPVKEEANCGLHQLKTKKKKKSKWWKRKSSSKFKNINENIDLFEKKHLYGFWPCIDDNYEQPLLTGKIEMELELLTQEEAEQRPVGKGHDEPNANPFLAQPNRPDVMVQWMLAPLKAFKVGVWDKIKWHLLTVLLILLLIAFVLIGIYTFPQAVVDRIVRSF